MAQFLKEMNSFRNGMVDETVHSLQDTEVGKTSLHEIVNYLPHKISGLVAYGGSEYYENIDNRAAGKSFILPSGKVVKITGVKDLDNGFNQIITKDNLPIHYNLDSTGFFYTGSELIQARARVIGEDIFIMHPEKPTIYLREVDGFLTVNLLHLGGRPPRYAQTGSPIEDADFSKNTGTHVPRSVIKDASLRELYNKVSTAMSHFHRGEIVRLTAGGTYFAGTDVIIPNFEENAGTVGHFLVSEKGFFEGDVRVYGPGLNIQGEEYYSWNNPFFRYFPQSQGSRNGVRFDSTQSGNDDLILDREYKVIGTGYGFQSFFRAIDHGFLSEDEKGLVEIRPKPLTKNLNRPRPVFNNSTYILQGPRGSYYFRDTINPASPLTSVQQSVTSVFNLAIAFGILIPVSVIEENPNLDILASERTTLQNLEGEDKLIVNQYSDNYSNIDNLDTDSAGTTNLRSKKNFNLGEVVKTSFTSGNFPRDVVYNRDRLYFIHGTEVTGSSIEKPFELGNPEKRLVTPYELPDNPTEVQKETKRLLDDRRIFTDADPISVEGNIELDSELLNIFSLDSLIVGSKSGVFELYGANRRLPPTRNRENQRFATINLDENNGLPFLVKQGSILHYSDEGIFASRFSDESKSYESTNISEYFFSRIEGKIIQVERAGDYFVYRTDAGRLYIHLYDRDYKANSITEVKGNVAGMQVVDNVLYTFDNNGVVERVHFTHTDRRSLASRYVLKKDSEYQENPYTEDYTVDIDRDDSDLIIAAELNIKKGDYFLETGRVENGKEVVEYFQLGTLKNKLNFNMLPYTYVKIGKFLTRSFTTLPLSKAGESDTIGLLFEKQIGRVFMNSNNHTTYNLNYIIDGKDKRRSTFNVPTPGRVLEGKVIPRSGNIIFDSSSDRGYDVRVKVSTNAPDADKVNALLIKGNAKIGG